MYISDNKNHRIRKVTVSSGIIITIAGSSGTGSYSGDNGSATSATLYGPIGIALDSAGTHSLTYLFISFAVLFSLLNHLGNVYIADQFNHRIRKVTVSTGIITTYAGTGSTTFSGDNGPATSASLYYPYGVELDSAGTYLLTYMCSDTLTYFYLGNVYIGDNYNHRVRKVTISTGILTTIAGNGGTGSYSGDGGAATSAALNYPRGVALDAAGTHSSLLY